MRQEYQPDSSHGFSAWVAQVGLRLSLYAWVGLVFGVAQMIVGAGVAALVKPGPWIQAGAYLVTSVRVLDPPSLVIVATMGVALCWQAAVWSFVFVPAWLLFPRAVRWFGVKAAAEGSPSYVRGTQLSLDGRGERSMPDQSQGVIPVEVETRHAFVCGRPGVGKTVAVAELLFQLLDRPEGKRIVYDFKGDYLSRFYRSGDLIFNPLDSRCVQWTMFNELTSVMDIDAFAYSLIPEGSREEAFWNNAARDVFRGILHWCYREGRTTNAHVWEALSAPGEDLSAWLKGTPGGEAGWRAIEDGTSRQAMGVLANMAQFTRGLEYLKNLDGPFSLREWVSQPGGGTIYVTSYANIKDTIRPVVSLFVDLVGRNLLSLPDARDRRIFFILDEFGTLQRLSSILQLLTLGRSKGAAVYLSIQDIGQLDHLYTESHRQTIVNACGNALVFAVADPDTAEFWSEHIGEVEYYLTEASHSSGGEEGSGGLSWARRKVREAAVLPSELQQLPDLSAYVKLSGSPWFRRTFSPRSYPHVAEAFCGRSDLLLPMPAVTGLQMAAVGGAGAVSSGCIARRDSQVDNPVQRQGERSFER